jgi:hypothetical protein
LDRGVGGLDRRSDEVYDITRGRCERRVMICIRLDTLALGVYGSFWR